MDEGAARVDRYYLDGIAIVKSGVEPKMCSEIKKLRQWLTKHQTEMLPDGAKQKLLSAVEAYFLYCCKRPDRFEGEVGDVVTSLVSDLLKLPEGKLISAKSKLKALKWLETTAVSKEASVSPTPSSSTRWVVGDIDEAGKLMLMSERPGSSDLIEDFTVDDGALLARIQETFDREAPVLLELDGDRRIIAVRTDDDGDS